MSSDDWAALLTLYGMAAAFFIVRAVANDWVDRNSAEYRRVCRLITEEEMEQRLIDIRLRTYRSIPLALVWPVWVVWFLVTDYRRVRRARQPQEEPPTRLKNF